MPQGDEVVHLMLLTAHRKGLRGSIVCVKDNSSAKTERASGGKNPHAVLVSLETSGSSQHPGSRVNGKKLGFSELNGLQEV